MYIPVVTVVTVQTTWYPKYSSPTVNQAQTAHTPISTLQLCVLLFSPFYQTFFQAGIKSSTLQLTNQFGSQRLSICRTSWPWGFETQQYRSKASLRTRSQPARMSWHQSPQRVVRLAEGHHHSKVIKPNPWDAYQQYSEIFGMTRQQQATQCNTSARVRNKTNPQKLTKLTHSIGSPGLWSLSPSAVSRMILASCLCWFRDRVLLLTKSASIWFCIKAPLAQPCL